MDHQDFWRPTAGLRSATDDEGMGQPYTAGPIKTLLGLKPSSLVWQRGDNGYIISWRRYPGGLAVIETLERHSGKVWLHVSASATLRVPTWEEMKVVKETFIGLDREAYSVFPPLDRYVNDHPHVLHLFCPLDGPVLPDFRRRGPNGRMTL